MADSTNRYALPLLVSGQAQKEITHNEALLLIDALAHPAIESRSLAAPPLSPQPGQLWLVAAAATGDWLGKSAQLALWTSGGWRFIAPRDGMLVWSKPDGAALIYSSGAWQVSSWPVLSLSVAGQQVVGPRGPAVADPVGGTVVDLQARAAISGLLSALRSHGLIAT
jgi:hypothetical protein